MVPTDTPAATEPGVRPRVEGERELEIFDATLEILTEVGYDRLTMDAVATAAKASKATLYRRWSGKADLVLDAMLSRKAPPPLPDTGNLRDDLVASFCGPGHLTDPQEIQRFGAILTAITTDADFAEGFRERVIGPKAARSRELFDRAHARGELRDGLDLGLIAPALPGIVLHRTFLLGEAPTPERVTQVIDQIILPAVLKTQQTNEKA